MFQFVACHPCGVEEVQQKFDHFLFPVFFVEVFGAVRSAAMLLHEDAPVLGQSASQQFVPSDVSLSSECSPHVVVDVVGTVAFRRRPDDWWGIVTALTRVDPAVNSMFNCDPRVRWCFKVIECIANIVQCGCSCCFCFCVVAARDVVFCFVHSSIAVRASSVIAVVTILRSFGSPCLSMLTFNGSCSSVWLQTFEHATNGFP